MSFEDFSAHWGNGRARPSDEDPFGDQRDSGDPTRQPLEIEWAADVCPRQGEWIVKGLLPRSGLASIHGPSRAGKSFLAVEWGLAIATGEAVLGLRTKCVGVAYVAAEAANGVRKRIRAWLQEHGHEAEFVPFALIARAIDLSNPESADLDELIQLLMDARVEFREAGEPLGIVFVDTLARATAGADENSSADMGAALAAQERIGDTLGVLVCVIHHVGKDASRGARGHSSFFAALDTAIELTHDEATSIRTLKIAKQKDDEDGRSWGFWLRSVTIGHDADGDAITSCVVEYTDAPASSSSKRRAPVQEASKAIVLEALRAVLSTHGQRPAGVPHARTAHAAPYEMVRQRAFEIGLSREGETPAAKRTRWGRALEGLAAAKAVHVWRSENSDDGWIWLGESE